MFGLVPCKVFEIDGIAGPEVDNDHAVAHYHDVAAFEVDCIASGENSGGMVVAVEELHFDTFTVFGFGFGLAVLFDERSLHEELEFTILTALDFGIFNDVVGQLLGFEHFDFLNVVAA